jgi:hypothetical protein
LKTGTATVKTPELGELWISPEYVAFIVKSPGDAGGRNSTSQLPPDKAQLEDGEKVPERLEKETLPVGDTPVTVTSQFVGTPLATTDGEQETTVDAAGGTLTTAKTDGSRATETSSIRPVETASDGMRLAIPKTASKNEINPPRIGETVVPMVTTMPPKAWSMEAVRDDERVIPMPARPCSMVGARPSDAERVAMKLAAPARAGIRPTASELVTPAMS